MIISVPRALAFSLKKKLFSPERMSCSHKSFFKSIPAYPLFITGCNNSALHINIISGGQNEKLKDYSFVPVLYHRGT